MAEHFADRLLAAMHAKDAPVCVGFDPLIDRLPESLRQNLAGESKTDRAARDRAAAEVLLRFGRGVIAAVAPYVPALKINIAFFERYRVDGLRVYYELIHEAHAAGLVVIGDVKRADIGHSSTQYAVAHLGDEQGGGAPADALPDAVTVNPYFGSEGVAPFVDLAAATGRGVFVLVQTSNESAAQVQGLTLADGSTVCHRVAQLVQDWAGARGRIGRSGYSCVGAVVSPRDLESTERIRALMPNCLFLVPGFGAQGRTPDEAAKCFKPDGTGAIITASRSVIYSYEDAKYRERHGDDWSSCIAQACQDFVNVIRGIARPKGSC